MLSDLSINGTREWLQNIYVRYFASMVSWYEADPIQIFPNVKDSAGVVGYPNYIDPLNSVFFWMALYVILKVGSILLEPKLHSGHKLANFWSILKSVFLLSWAAIV